MYQVPDGGGRFTAELQLVGGVVVQYIATRLAIGAASRSDGSTPGRLALAQWLPVVVTAAAAMFQGQAQVAFSLVFGSSVACLSLVMGMMIYVGPLTKLPSQRRVWSMLLPVSILILLAGFRGFLTWYHALMLLVLGAAILAMWLEPLPADDPVNPSAPSSATPALGPLIAIPALFLACFGAWVAMRGTLLAGAPHVGPELLASTILSPLLVLPALGAGTMLAQHGHADRAVTSICGTVLLNLCVLLPGIVIANYAMGLAQHQPRPLPFPLITWRLDAVLLLVLSFALVPVAIGRWLPTRFEAILLVVVYVGYMVAQTLLSVKLII